MKPVNGKSHEVLSNARRKSRYRNIDNRRKTQRHFRNRHRQCRR